MLQFSVSHALVVALRYLLLLHREKLIDCCTSKKESYQPLDIVSFLFSSAPTLDSRCLCSSCSQVIPQEIQCKSFLIIAMDPTRDANQFKTLVMVIVCKVRNTHTQIIESQWLWPRVESYRSLSHCVFMCTSFQPQIPIRDCGTIKKQLLIRNWNSMQHFVCGSKEIKILEKD